MSPHREALLLAKTQLEYTCFICWALHRIGEHDRLRHLQGACKELIKRIGSELGDDKETLPAWTYNEAGRRGITLVINDGTAYMMRQAYLDKLLEDYP